MKQKDIAVLGAVVVVSAIFSLVVSNYIFAAPSNRQQKVEVISKISPTFTTPSTTYFNKDSIDPTQTIQVGLGSNPTPFGTAPNGVGQ